MEEQLNYIISGIIALAIWFFKSQMDRRYKEQFDINNQVQVNTQSILENKLRDEASINAFEIYKETINGDFDKMEESHRKILDALKELNNTVTELKITIGNLKS